MHERPRKALTPRRMLLLCGSVAVPLGLILLGVGAWLGPRSLLWTGLWVLVVGVLWLLCARFSDNEPMRPAQRRYLREFFPAMAGYVLLLFASATLLPHVASVPLRVMIVLLPIVPIVFVVRAMVRQVMASDELQRRLELEAISIASLSVGLLSFAAAFLRGAGLLPIDNALMLVLPALFGAYGIAKWWVGRRYRGQ